MKQVIVLTIMLIIISPMIFANSLESSFFNPNLNTQSLFNPNNLKLNHSMTFMSGVSSGGKGFYQSVYTNHLLYQFNPKLDLRMDLNFVNYGTSQWKDNMSVSANNDNRSAVVPEFSLHYRPTDNTLIRIEYRQSLYPGYDNNWRW